ncbi:MAG: DivIVA domain-containing protein [Thermoleophilaceae bacterium]
MRNVDFPVAFRGYDRAAVDRHLQEISQLVAELEARQLRESVVQRALDEVGEQTATILSRANEAADEVGARSKAQAEGRIQRAEREADAIRREAQEDADRLRADTLRLWGERQQLIEEIRHLADETLSVADVALERLSEPPRMGPSEVPPDEEGPSDAAPTVEDEAPNAADAEGPPAEPRNGGPSQT